MIRIMHKVMQHAGKYKTRIRCSYISALIKGIMMKMPMFMCLYAISLFMEGKMDEKKCLFIGLAVLTGVILQAVFEHVTNVLQSAAGYMVFSDMRLKLGEHLRKLPMGYFTEGNMGKISTVLATDMVFIEEICMPVLAELVTFLISQGLMVLMMFFLDYRVGILSLVVIGAFILIGHLMMDTTLKHSKLKQKAAETLSDSVIDFAEGMGIIKSYNLLGEKSKSLTKQFEESCDKNIAFEEDYGPWNIAMNMTYGIGTALILALSAFLYLRGSITPVYFVSVVFLLFDLFLAIKAFYGQMARLTVTSASLERIDEVFEEVQLPDEGKEVLPEEDTYVGNEIEYDNVTFGYTDKDILKNVSFEVKKGEMVALVGPSGGGKSTIASLIARLWDVKDGAIKVRGVDIKKVPMSNLMDNISIVFQRVYLFQDTVYNNIAIGRPEATKEEVTEAAKKARCLEFIEKLPEGFDTVIGEGGASLSGGEKQRLSIARCLLKDSPIIILDEATASVDADNEKAIQEAINELVVGKTLIVIAHRIKTIKNANNILVISDGKICEEGTHEELVKLGGIYKSFVDKSA
ncbi:MAG: ABC transporter ATP-binding protein/permease [Lachnospiraceae bacterium]|nr:ABC transporter ATP-binding protein/permease [Lachnospiraceae bacterium]